MDELEKIQSAIEKLADEQLEELAKRIDALRVRRATPVRVEQWLKRAVGAAKPGVTTDEILRMTRGED